MPPNKAHKRSEFLVPFIVEGSTSAELDRITTGLNFSASHRLWADGIIRYGERAPAAGAYRLGGKGGRIASATVMPLKWIALKQNVLRSNSQEDLHKARRANVDLRVHPNSVLNFFAPPAAWGIDALNEKQEARAQVEFATVTRIAKTLTPPFVDSLKSGFARLLWAEAGDRKFVFMPSDLMLDDEIMFEHDGRRIWLRVRGPSRPGKIHELIQQCYQHLAFSRRMRRDLIDWFGLKIGRSTLNLGPMPSFIKA